MARFGHTTTLKTLLAARVGHAFDFDSGSLQVAAYGGHTSTIDCMLEAGANVNSFSWAPITLHHPGSYTCTALHAAAHNGHLATVERLLEAGADVGLGKRSEHFKTFGNALDEALERGHMAVVERLRLAGAVPEIITVMTQGHKSFKSPIKTEQGR